MYITYHKEMPIKGKETYFPHDALDRQIREFIEAKGVKHHYYLVSCNEYYLFIYLPEGNRIDVQL